MPVRLTDLDPREAGALGRRIRLALKIKAGSI
jgi:hypothetical protein